jgi:hypothetical protein
VTSPHPTEPAGGIRQFTVIAWLLWTLIPALALGVPGWVTDYVKESAGNTDPGRSFGRHGHWYLHDVVTCAHHHDASVANLTARMA